MKLMCLLAFVVPLYRLDAQSTEEAIRAVLATQTEAWNKANLGEFAATYAPSCTLVGSSITQVTRDEVLAHYREKYPTPARMGRLTFQNVKVIPLDERHAIALAKWHLDRKQDAGGPAGGVFSLVLERQGTKWLILLDHTS